MYQSFQRFLNKKQPVEVEPKKTTKEEFLLEHNRLSPENLQATANLLSRFKIEKPSMFKDDNDWSIDKLRRPFLSWLISLPIGEKEKIEKEKT